MKTHGIPIQLDWDRFKIGASFFVPGIDREELEKSIRAEMQRLQVNVITRRVVENNILGVRVWRKP